VPLNQHIVVIEAQMVFLGGHPAMYYLLFIVCVSAFVCVGVTDLSGI